MSITRLDGVVQKISRQHCGKFAYLLPALLTATVALTACSPKKAPSTNQTGTGPANTDTSQQVTVHLAYFPNITHAVALVGTANGEFAKAFGPGVKIEEQSFNAGPSEIEALFAEGVDIGYIGPGPAINGFLKSKGKALTIIAGASSGGTGLVVRDDAGVTDVKSLAGKKVAVPQTGGTQDISLRHALQIAGLNSTDKGGNVSVLPVTPADTLTLFQKKELDAAWVTEPWISRLVKEGHASLKIDERDLWAQKRFATTVVIVRNGFLKEHPDLVAKFLTAHVQTVDWIGTHPDEAAKLVGDQIKKLNGKSLPPDILKSSFSRTDFTYDPLKETVLTFADWSKSLGYLKDDRSALGALIDTTRLNTALKGLNKPAVP